MIEVTFDHKSDMQRRFNGYAAASFPDPRDDELGTFLTRLIAGGPSAVGEASREATESARRVLCAFAERSASLAVRDESYSHLLSAVVALTVGGLAGGALEAIMRMPLVEDAAHRIGVGLPNLFEEAAGLVAHPGSVALMMWLGRAPEDRTLASMGFEADDGETGFRYRWSAS